MSQDRDTKREILDRVKVIAEMVDKVIFETFPFLGEKGYLVDGRDKEKPLGFARLDNYFARLDIFKEMLMNSDKIMLTPPYPGLYRLHNCVIQQKLDKILKEANACPV